MKRGDELVIRIEKFGDRGKTISKPEGRVVMINGGAPGDLARVVLTKAKRKFAEAKIVEIIESSPDRTEPVCQYFGHCGGCKWQHLSYPAQLQAKTGLVKEALERIGGFEGLSVPVALGAETPYAYRNKMEFSFSAKRWLTTEEIASKEVFNTNFALGMHAPGSYDKVLDLYECHLMPAEISGYINLFREWCHSKSWKGWDVRTHEGYLRHLVVRRGEMTGDLMFNLVTNAYNEDNIQWLAKKIKAEIPAVTSFTNTINTSVAQTSYGERVETIFGPGVIRDKIGDYSFTIGPSAFFQTNTKGAATLYGVVLDFLDPKADETVYDLYSGAGTISLFISKFVKNVVGVEVVKQAIENAKANAKENKVDNCKFVLGDMLKVFNQDFVSKHGKPDAIIVDPPRAGMHPKVVKRIGELGPDKLVYVSCNPRTQAADLEMIKEWYEIDRIQPVDMFPQTHHIENVVRLNRIK